MKITVFLILVSFAMFMALGALKGEGRGAQGGWGGDHFQSFDFEFRLLDSESKFSKPSTFRFILESHAFKLDSES